MRIDVKGNATSADEGDVASTDLVVTNIDRVVRFRWALISCWLGIVGALSAVWPGDGDWGYFRTGARALIGQPAAGASGGIHLYASMPSVQIGPPALLLALPFNWLPRPWDVGVARVLMSLSVLLVLLLADRLAEAMGVTAARRHRAVLLGGVMLIPAWVTVAVDFAHLDDVLVLALGTLATLLVAKDRPLWAASVVGLAVATKPWAIVMAPLLLRSGWRQAVRPLALSAGVAVAWWVPFLTDPHTLGKLWGFRLPVSVGTGLSVLGLDAGVSMPGWVRPAQLFGGVLLGVVAVRRGNWTGVLLVGLANRVALDPNPLFYYAAGPVLGALIWDLTRAKSGVPWATGFAMAGFSLAPFASDPHTLGALRLAICAGLILAVLLVRAPRPVPVETRPELEPAYA